MAGKRPGEKPCRKAGCGAGGQCWGFRELRDSPEQRRGSEDGPDGDVRDAGREEPDGTLIAISVLV